jgi:ATP-binding cassette subfamily G (WHITE) protein 2 (SNQ2)
MLDVIGAGATATTAFDWHTIWTNSSEAAALQEEIEKIHDEGRARPVVQAQLPTEFATSWSHQVMFLTQRNFQAYWRNPTYLMAKFALCIACGLLIGFTFFNTSDSLQGTQTKLFVCDIVRCMIRLLTVSIGYIFGVGDLCRSLAATSDYIHRYSVYL